MRKLRYYIQSLRLRTLPLSMSGIVTGYSLAYDAGYFNTGVFVLTMLTTVFLQILSNISNEYGDGQNGVDNSLRVGPIRSLQTGALSMKDFKKMIFLFVFLSSISGLLLIVVSFGTVFCIEGLIMLSLGLLAIAAAIKYTVGENNYGYKGFGDVAVFIFFGLAGVAGVYYLSAHNLAPDIFLPATGIGMFSVGVLNVNNIRDRQSDKECNKNTLVVKLGEKKAKIYHFALIAAGWLCFIIHTAFHCDNLWNWLYLLLLPLYAIHLLAVFRYSDHKLDVQLRNLSLMTFLLSILYGISLII